MAAVSTGDYGDPLVARTDPAKAVMAAQPFVTAASAVLDIDGLENTRVGGCGATVITVNWLLTAAHCVLTPLPPLAHTDVPRLVAPAQVRVRIGSADRTSGGTVRAITQIDIDPEFTYPDYAHDFAALRLDQPVAATSVAVLGAVLPGTSTRALVWTTTTLADGTHPPRAAVARYAPAEILDNGRCPFLIQTDYVYCFDAAAGAGGFGSGGSGLFRVDNPAAISLVGVISSSGNVEQTTGIANPVLLHSTWLRKFLPT
ncbi:trypsin-like serine protease [Amycolatopsis sp. cmx-4-61]|uniref:trypsin-like serine protease n=1 Tax=Amycolatopsis sp. cmx-4-61 TaxID=2790937 RepID=UPI00397855FE